MVINILFNTKCVISVTLCYLSVFVSKVYYITMSILSIVSILRFLTVPEVILRNKICPSDIAISLIELIVYYIRNNLLITVPDMIYCLTIDSLFISKTVCVVLVACCRFTVCESDKLI